MNETCPEIKWIMLGNIEGNGTLASYRPKTRFGSEFLLGSLFLFLTLLMLITTGFKVRSYYAMKRSGRLCFSV